MTTDGKSDVDDKDHLKFFGLGGCNEVGRSCHIIQYKGKTIMLDAGIHPAHAGLSALPFYDEFDLETVDILLISHFHLDHAGSLPYVMQHTNFKGRVFMTHPTKAIYRWLLGDFVRVTSIGNDDNSANLYTDDDLAESFDKIETIDYHSTLEIDGVRFTAYHAGHVLGAAMFMVEVGGLKVLFTGDYSREEDRHLNIAEIPPQRPDILITESTFGTATHEPREDKETRLTNLIHSTISKGGRCLLPVFALGRAQEILLILDEYWEEHKDLQNISIYYASSLARKCMAVYQTYINMMNDSIRKKFRDQNSNPFSFKYIKSIRNLDKFDDFGPCVILASPGMLQNGVSRELLERWAPESKNALILTGYSVEGTMAKDIITEPPSIPSVNNPDISIPRRMSVEEISFAAHVDFEQNSKFIELINPKSIILVHGESNPMGRLKSALLSKYQKLKNTDQEVKIYNPRNCDEVKLTFKGIKVLKVMGSLAESLPQKDQILSGVIVQKDFDLNLLRIQDLREFSSLSTSIVKERTSIKTDASIHLIIWHLTQMFGFIDISNEDDDEVELSIMENIQLTFEKESHVVTLEWLSGVINDTIADSVIAILLSVDSSPASVKLSSKSCNHDHSGKHSAIKSDKLIEITGLEDSEKDNGSIHADSSIGTRIRRITTLLEAQFGDSFTPNDDNLGAIIAIGKNEAKINYINLKVECGSNVLKNRIDNVIKRAVSLVAPLAQRSRG